jgi:iron complex outermembrane receptor protein
MRLITVLMPAMVLVPFAAQAQEAEGEGLEEVVVTAQFRTERLQDTPIAITAVTEDMMRQRSQDSIFDVTQQAPNVQIKKNSGPFGASTSAFIRGVGQGDFNFALEPGVGMYIDDVYFPTMTGSAFEIVDLERVEVLRGPQGTLQGRNAIGGSVRLITKKPTGEGDGYAELTTGRFDRIGGRAAGEFSLVPDKLFLRITGAANSQEGYVERKDFACDQPALAAQLGIASVGEGRTGCKLGTLGGQSYTAGRANLRWVPSDKLEVNFIGDLTNDRSEATANVTVNAPQPSAMGPAYGPWFESGNGEYVSYETFSDPNGGVAGRPFNTEPINHYTSWGLAAIIDYRLSDTMSLKSITSRRNIENDFSTAHDGSPINGETGFNELKGHSWQQEVRLNGEAGPVNYTLGLFYFTQKNQNRNRIDIGYLGFPFDFVSDEVAESDSKAAFAHAVWAVNDKLNLTAGLRYSDEEKDQLLGRLSSADGGNSPSVFFGELAPDGYADVVTFSGDRFDYRVSLDYRWTDTFMTYVNHATGFKAGGVSPRFFTSAHISPFQPEEMKAYEIGFKSDLLDNRLRINAAYFFNDYTDQQAGAAGATCPDLVPPGPSPPCLAIRNETDTEIRGAELEVTYRPTLATLIDFSASQIESKFTRISPRTLQNPLFRRDPGAPFGIPEYKLSLGVQHGFAMPGGGSLTPRFDANYEAKKEGAETRSAVVPAFTVYNARLTWRSAEEDWEVSGAVTNLTDKYYYYNLFDLRFFGTGGFGWTAGQPAPPREWALTVRRTF